jgi:chromosome segregation ATPase
MKKSSLILNLAMFTALTTNVTVVWADYDLDLQNVRDRLPPREQKSSQQASRLQIGAFINDIKTKQEAGISIDQDIATMRNQITENEGKRTEIDQQVVDIIESFVKFLTDQKNLGHTEILLEFVPDDQKNLFNDKINDMIPLIRKYDGSLEEFKKLNKKLDGLQDKLRSLEEKNDLANMEEQKSSLVKEYEQMNAQNQQISQQQSARNNGRQATAEALAAARLKESQLEREVNDLLVKIQANSEKLKTDDVNRKQAKVLGSPGVVLTPLEKNKLLTENKVNNAAVQQKTSELNDAKKDVVDLVGQIKRSGEQKTVSLHEDLSKKLDEINDVQTRINKLQEILKGLRAQEITLRKSQEEQETKLVPLKNELIEAFHEIINMLKGLPITKSNENLEVAKQLIQRTKDRFPPSTEGMRDMQSESKGTPLAEENSADFRPSPDSSFTSDDLSAPQRVDASSDFIPQPEERNSDVAVPSGSPKKSLDTVVRQQKAMLSATKAFSAELTSPASTEKQSVAAPLSALPEKKSDLNGSQDESIVSSKSLQVVPSQNARSFAIEMNKLKLASKNNAIIHLDAQKRCIAAAKIIVKSPQVDQRNLLTFLKDNKAFMGITYRAVALDTLTKVMATLPLPSTVATEEKLIKALCH